jgi:hypothetical protein
MIDVRVAGAYHNYLVDGKLQMELRVGDRGQPSGFFLEAHRVLPGDPMPLISGRFFGPDGGFLVRVERNVLVENPHAFALRKDDDGWRLTDATGATVLHVEVCSFENSHMTVLRGVLHDPTGKPVVRGDDRGLHPLR